MPGSAAAGGMRLRWPGRTSPRAPATTGRRSPRASPAPGATLFVPFAARARGVEDDRPAPGVVRRPDEPAHRQGPRPAEAESPPSRATIVPGMPGGSPSIDGVTVYWRDHYDDCARKASASAIASTTPRCRRKWSRRWPPTSPSSSRPPSCARPTAGSGAGKAAATTRAAATAPARTSGTTPRPSRTSSRPGAHPARDGVRTARRTSAAIRLPRRPARSGRSTHDFHAAADGQLGGIMKVYRDWRISGDTDWLRGALAEGQAQPRLLHRRPGTRTTRAWLEEPHHNTYDIEFWGPDGMCTSFYLGALQAAVAHGPGARRGRRRATPSCSTRAAAACETELFNGEYFIQKIEWKGLRADDPIDSKSMAGSYSPEARGAAGEGRPEVPVRHRLPLRRRARRLAGAGLRRRPGRSTRGRSRSHLRAVHRHNLKHGPLRLTPTRSGPAYACGARGRAAAVHLAQGRRAVAAVRLQRRGLDRHRVPGRPRT